MKILLATPSMLPEAGGPGAVLQATARHLREAGCEVATLSRKGQGGEHAGEDGRGYFFSGFDLVHNYGVWSPFNHQVALSAHRAHLPQVFCPMGMLEPWALKQKALKKKLAWWLYQRRDIARAAVIHATSRMEADNLRLLGVKNPIAVIPHGVELPEMAAERMAEEPADAIRTVLFLSRLHPKKGVLELVEAWARLRPAGWQLLIAGPDTDGYAALVNDAITRHGLTDRVRLIGAVYGEDKAELWRVADLFVLPTHSENFGLVVPEALAHGVPVITTTAAPWHQLTENRCGWWIAPGEQALIRALDEAVRQPSGALREMGERGRRLVEEKYGWPAVIRQQLELYRWLLQNSSKPQFVLERGEG